VHSLCDRKVYMSKIEEVLFFRSTLSRFSRPRTKIMFGRCECPTTRLDATLLSVIIDINSPLENR